MKLKEKVKTASLASVNYINAMKDILIGTATNRQVLVYDSATGKWKNDFLDLEDLGDTNITSPTNGDCLLWNGSDWVAAPATLESLKDTTLPSPDKNTLIYFDSITATWKKVPAPRDRQVLGCAGGELGWLYPQWEEFEESFEEAPETEVSYVLSVQRQDQVATPTTELIVSVS